MEHSTHVFHRFVVKIGASVLTDTTGQPDTHRLRQFVEQVAAAINRGHEVVVVSSGAIACGMHRLGLKRRPRERAQLQACAAIGQGELMRLYSEAFAAFQLTVAQILLTQADLANRTRCGNAKQTLRTLLARQVVPIVNENDTVAVEEITFGDNDRLAALVACLISARLLVMLSDVEGLLHEGQVIRRIDRLDHAYRAIALGPSKETTTGGMASKLAAARIVRHAGIPLVVANGTRPGILQEILDGRPVGTLIVPPQARLRFRKWWVAFSARAPLGTLVIDAGAVEALCERGKSLLASGVREVRGRFQSGDSVTIVDEHHQEIARGITNFSSGELGRIQGLKSGAIMDLLGRKVQTEVVHRDNLVLTKELEG